MRNALRAAFGLLFAASVPAGAMELASPDLRDGGTLAPAQVYGPCGGGNVAPRLFWRGAPKGTKSFVVSLYDPDAQGGWWHWLVYDIPAATAALDGAHLPPGAREGRNDFGQPGYGGACPPVGSGPHRYQFTVWAMDSAVLPRDGGDDDKRVGAYVESHALAHATLTALYERR